MPIGDIASGLASVDAGAYLEIQPGVGVEWVVHTIYHESDIELYFSDGGNNLLFDSVGGMGATSCALHVTNARWVRVKNTDAAPKLIGYDGVVTR
jgi:hypothetical protein